MKPGDITSFGTVARVFPFKSKTNPAHSYECLVYASGTMSCNCKGWTMARNGKRSCKHTELVAGQLEQGFIPAPIVNGRTAAVASRPAALSTGRRFNFDE